MNLNVIDAASRYMIHSTSYLFHPQADECTYSDALHLLMTAQ